MPLFVFTVRRQRSVEDYKKFFILEIVFMKSAVLTLSLNRIYGQLLLAAVVLCSFFAVSVPWAQADEVSDLRLRVGVLEERILSLEEKSGEVLGATMYCPKIVQNLRRGMSDAATTPAGQVSELQKFLAAYYNVPTALIVVGTFGPITSGYVMDFQVKQGIQPTGNVANMTRRAIAAVCAGSATTTGATLSVSPATGVVPLTANFTLQNGVDGVMYGIDFDDKSPIADIRTGGGVLSNVSHTYLSAGNYKVKLMKKTATSSYETISRTEVNVDSAAPSFVSFTGPSTLKTTEVGVWTISATNTIGSYKIDWRDGLEGGNDSLGASKTSVSHQYINPGTYRILLTAKGPGGTATTSAMVVVTDPAAPSIVSFTGPSTLKVKEVGTWTINATNTIDYYHIDWRDGEVGGNDNFRSDKTTLTHHYNNPGTYTIILAARGPGGRATTTRTVTVTAPVTATTTPVFTIEAVDSKTLEGNAGASFRVNRKGTADTTFSLGISVSGTAIRNTDYKLSGGEIAANGTIIFPLSVSSVRISVAAIEDAIAEGDETIILTLLPATGSTLGSSTSATVTITDNDKPADTAAPVVTITAPAANASVMGTVTVSAGATDNVGVTNVKFYLDGTLVKTDVQAPYQNEWKTTEAANGSHILSAVATDQAGNAATSSVTVTVANPDTRAPMVSLTAPKDGARVSGTVAVSAEASDNTGVVGVQFKVNRVNIGAEDTTAPYAVDWNSKEVAKGSYNITATARDAAGNMTTSAANTVTVNNASASADYANLLASAAAAPFSLLVDRLTELLVYAGIGQ